MTIHVLEIIVLLSTGNSKLGVHGKKQDGYRVQVIGQSLDTCSELFPDGT